MAVNSTFTPKASLTDAPTNLKEAIDWVLRVTGRDGKENKDECICGLAAAVTDLLQSVQLEYHGYEGESNGTDTNKGPPKERVDGCLNELFSLVQGLGGAAVVRTYIDQLAQVLSALVGWSKIEKCDKGYGECNGGGKGNEHGHNDGCTYLQDVKHENKCDTCGCMKWVAAPRGSDWVQLGRGCTRCKDEKQKQCDCTGGCTPGKCKCAKASKCCKCYCKEGCKDKCKKDAKCICDKEDKSYKSAYPKTTVSWIEGGHTITWKQLKDTTFDNTGHGTPSNKRLQCARILLGSVCLIWSGLTYMYWTGKYHKSSPRWNNHILDGTGLDDGTLSQWLQALGFPRDMLNNHGPKNRWDAIIWDGFRGMLYLGFPNTGTGGNVDIHGHDNHGNTFRDPSSMNYAGYIHTLEKGAFCSQGNVFKNGATITEENINKCGALYKLYILSCAYFTGLQNKALPKAENRTPKTIREILYWLSALPYSQAYKKILKHGKDRLTEVLKKPDGSSNSNLSFLQTGRNHPITVHEFNLFAHFQAVTQYCPLVLIGIQGGIHSTTKGTDKTLEPAIHSLYANTECNFTYPSVDIQAYNQVVHYIRALFYQLYFLRKQCAVKVTCGGKWRECRYGKDVVSKGVISWMCLGCDPMEHDRNYRVEKIKEGLKSVPQEKGSVPGALKDLLEKIGDVVVQLGNAQERLDRGNASLDGVRQALNEVFTGVNNGSDLKGVLGKVIDVVLEVVEKLVEGVEKKVKALKNGKKEAQTALKEAKTKLEKAKTKIGEAKNALTAAKDAFPGSSSDIDPCKNIVSASIDGLHKALQLLKEAVQQIIEATKKDTTEFQDAIIEASDTADVVTKVEEHQATQKVTLDALSSLLSAINQLISICNSPKCPSCKEHSTKCGKQPQSKYCEKCHQQYMDGTPSPLQAFLEDRLPGFSCDVVRDIEDPDKYPPAAAHLGHCNGSGQCCPLPMGFRGQFQQGITHTGQRLYGILYFFSNENMMQSCVYTLVRVTAALSATTPQVLGDVFGFFRGGVGEKEQGKTPEGRDGTLCNHDGNPSGSYDENKTKYFCGWCASGLRDVVKQIEWIPNGDTSKGGYYIDKVGEALRDIKGDKDASSPATSSSLSTLTTPFLSPLTGELYTAVSATFGNTYLSWVLYLSDALQWGLESLASEFKQIECRGCKGQCDPNKCKKGHHGTNGESQCGCQSIVSCTGVLPVLYRHGFSYGNPFNLEGYQQEGKDEGDYSIEKKKDGERQCHQFLDSLKKVIERAEKKSTQDHPLTNLLSEVGKLQYDIRLPWIFVLTVAWLVAVLYLAFGAIWPLDWTHMRSHWLRGGEHQWEAMWYKVMTGRKGMELVEYFGKT